jgi:ADP-heptose:LPS heptosyltransferase
MESFMLAQPNITAFKTLDPNSTEITHNLDLFRPLFVSHPGNYVDIYCEAFAVRDKGMQSMIRDTPWLTVPEPKTIEGKSYVVNRTQRWTSDDSLPAWQAIRDQAGDAAIFVGLPEEYAAFKQWARWDITYHPTATLLELAEVIAGAEQFIGNQSAALSLAIGLGTAYACELRRDLPQERNECWFPNQPNGEYF